MVLSDSFSRALAIKYCREKRGREQCCSGGTFLRPVSDLQHLTIELFYHRGGKVVTSFARVLDSQTAATSTPRSGRPEFHIESKAFQDRGTIETIFVPCVGINFHDAKQVGRILIDFSICPGDELQKR